ncbi:MAG: holo-ACP synthase [Vulcanibacillus sp.]
MIYGIGIDLVEIKRIKKILERKEKVFLNKILTIKEMEQYFILKNTKKIEYVAGRFAGKEAVSKAVGVGIGAQLGWKDIEILNSINGSPFVKINKEFSKKNKLVYHISISHTNELALAEVIIELI